jgi:hypothetical protein
LETVTANIVNKLFIASGIESLPPEESQDSVREAGRWKLHFEHISNECFAGEVIP